MLDQKEGSQAVADAIALCRPEVICAYPISPQTHIVEALSDKVRTGELSPCEYVSVESEFAAMSVAIGASAAGARPYTATASQGLLYMAEALYNASGPRPADRDDPGQPRDRLADQHLERPQRRDVAARLGLDPALRRVRPGGARPPHSGVQARRAALAAGDGLHGRLHPHPRVRTGGRAHPGAGGRLPAALRAEAGAGPGRAGDDRGHGGTGGLLRGQVPDARQADAGAGPDPRDRGRVHGDVRARVGRPRQRLPHRGRGDGGAGARIGARHDPGRGGRTA